MSYKTIAFDKRDDIAYVTLNRPEVLNIYNVQMRDDLYEVFTSVRDDPEIRAMIVRGAGRAYCAGADLSEFGSAPSPVIARDVRWGRDVWGVLRKLDKLTVAMMHGYALGSGLELALLCDIRIAAEGTKFGLPETSLGFIPAAGATQSLPRVVKQGTALWMILLGERIEANDAYRFGLVHQVVPADHLMPTTEATVRRILSGGPKALMLAKQAINRGLDLPLDEALRLEKRLVDLTLHTGDAQEGVRAIVERREPVFSAS